MMGSEGLYLKDSGAVGAAEGRRWKGGRVEWWNGGMVEWWKGGRVERWKENYGKAVIPSTARDLTERYEIPQWRAPLE
jgi:hypothetical protein